MQPLTVLEACLYASDLDAAEAFYTTVLGLPIEAREAGRHVFFRSGEAMFLVFNPAVTDDEPDSDIPPHGCHGAGHVAFAAAPDEIPAWADRLRAHGVVIERDVRWPHGARSLFFRDPAGNSVEIASRSLWGAKG